MPAQLKMKYEGRVQGVGFRVTVHQIAVEIGVVGWVANASDGSVHMVASGEDARLAELQQRVLEARSGQIVNAHQTWLDSQEAFEGFEIKPDIM